MKHHWQAYGCHFLAYTLMHNLLSSMLKHIGVGYFLIIERNK